VLRVEVSWSLVLICLLNLLLFLGPRPGGRGWPTGLAWAGYGGGRSGGTGGGDSKPKRRFAHIWLSIVVLVAYK